MMRTARQRAHLEKMKSQRGVKICKYPIEGVQYQHISSVFREAVARGFEGSESNISYRLGKGATTWAELLKPVDERISASRRAIAQKKRDEKAAVIAAMDARKAEGAA